MLMRKRRFLLLAGAMAAPCALAQPVSPTPVVQYEYDPGGHMTRVIVAPGVSGLSLATTMRRDRLARAIEVTDPALGRTAMGWDGRDGLTHVIDPRGLSTRYPRNGHGDLLALESPDTGVATHQHDSAGRLRVRADGRGDFGSSYGYDGVNRLRQVEHSYGGVSAGTFSWTYDQEGQEFGHGAGRLTTAAYPAGWTIYGYDALGRVFRTEQTVDAGSGPRSKSVWYGHDAAGRPTSITYPSGRVLQIGRAGGQIVSLGLAPGAGAAPLPLLVNIQSDPAVGTEGLVRSWSWALATGEARPHVRVFDTSGRLVRHPLGGALRDIVYDAADRIVGFRHVDASTGAATAETQALDQVFGYDALGRVTSVSTSVGSWAYAYDANGNRTQSRRIASGTTQVRNHAVAAASNRLLGLDNPARAMTHDGAGNTTSDASGGMGWTARHDASGRMVSLTVTGQGGARTELEFGHDARGQRVYKRVRGGAGVIFVYDLEGRLLGEYAGNGGAVLREYVWLQDTPVAVVDGTAASPLPYYIHADHLGTPRVAIDRNGALRWSWIVEPFGDAAPSTNPRGLGAFTLNLRMPGQYHDVESGLSHNWQREYDASVGRYTQSDPIGLAGGINTYGYSRGNPLSYVDPEGLAPGDPYRLPLQIGGPSSGGGRLGGAVAKDGNLRGPYNGYPKPPVVIGETMVRVEAKAAEVGGTCYRPTKPYDDIRNARWARDMQRDVIRQNRELIDIGIDPLRAIRSWSYELERRIFYPD